MVGSRLMSSAAAAYSSKFEHICVSSPRPFVLQVQLNRPDKRNALNEKLWREIGACMEQLSRDGDCRAVVLTGAGKAFCAGIDFADLAGMAPKPGVDAARHAWTLKHYISDWQQAFTNIEQCAKPVIAAIHGACMGAGVDMICACDVRHASQDAFFSIKEVDMGLAADIGTLQRLPKIVGNESLLRELALTARRFTAADALSFGLLSKVYGSAEEMAEGALDLAEEIASKSPVATAGTKLNLNYSRDHSVQDSLHFAAAWSMSQLQSEDVVTAATHSMSGAPGEPTFSKL